MERGEGRLLSFKGKKRGKEEEEGLRQRRLMCVAVC